jgi:hypothetical protein
MGGKLNKNGQRPVKCSWHYAPACRVFDDW